MLQREGGEGRTVPSLLLLAVVLGDSLARWSAQTGFRGPHLPRGGCPAASWGASFRMISARFSSSLSLLAC